MIDHSALMKRIEMMNKMKQSMGKDSLGEFDHLENVSMTYWDQQEQYWRVLIDKLIDCQYFFRTSF
jgi:hypothetical protein